MTRVSYTIKAKELATVVETTNYRDVVEAREKLHNVEVTTNYEKIPETSAKPTGKRAVVLKHQGFIRPSTFQEDYARAIEESVA